MHLLRTLGFDLRAAFPLALEYLPRMLDRAVTLASTPAPTSNSSEAQIAKHHRRHRTTKGKDSDAEARSEKRSKTERSGHDRERDTPRWHLEDFDAWSATEKDEYGVLHSSIDTALGQRCRMMVLSA